MVGGDIGPDFHLGHILKNAMIQHSSLLFQIDAATGKEETYGSVLSRIIKLAKCLRNFGLKTGDVVAISGFNHLDVCIPIYSCIFNGMTSIGIVPNYKYDEIKDIFSIAKPKIAFCERYLVEIFQKVKSDLKLDTKIIAFGNGDNSWSEFIETYNDDEVEEKFKIAEVDPNEINQFLICTSGSTGKAKAVAFTQIPFITKMRCYLEELFKKIDRIKGTNTLQMVTVNSIVSYLTLVSLPPLGQCRVQTSATVDMDVVIKMINKYKPISTVLTPYTMAEILKRKEKVDLSCFNIITAMGEKLNPHLYAEMKKCMRKDAILFESVGLTETAGSIFEYTPGCPKGSCGKYLLPCFTYKLVDPESGNDVSGPNILGEMWVKGPCFKEYFNDPEETKKALTEDGYFKTGDLYYRDENNYFYFANRIKTIIKWRANTLLPEQMEDVIRAHPGIKDVCVVGIKHPEDGERPVACVIREDGASVTAQDIKNHVIEKLSDRKQLRGGVVFMKEFPITSTEKVARKKLADIVANAIRE